MRLVDLVLEFYTANPDAPMYTSDFSLASWFDLVLDFSAWKMSSRWASTELRFSDAGLRRAFVHVASSHPWPEQGERCLCEFEVEPVLI